jgi:putative tryptophan/tyrosine transport system substrate-binding protein
MYKIILSLIISCLLAYSSVAEEEIKQKKILISKIVDHPALDATEAGIIDALSKAGYINEHNIIIRSESAQGNPVLASQIASKFTHQNADLVVAIGTITAQSFIKFARNNEVKMVFSSVTDPLESGLMLSTTENEKNITGVSNFVALDPQLQLFKQLQPNLQNLGIIYNPGESNSISIIKKLEEISSNYDINIIKKASTRVAEVAQAATSLTKTADAIFISNDNMALSALQSIIKIATDAGIPVYVSDTDAVELGAVAALGPNQYNIGIQTGNMIAKVLNGYDINKEKVEYPKKNDLYLNLDAAKKVNIIIPEYLINSASKIITLENNKKDELN